jgi:hypothetical protein
MIGANMHNEAGYDLPLMRELCSLISVRNDINRKRTKAKDKRGYYSRAAEAVELFNAKLDSGFLGPKETAFELYVSMFPHNKICKKWLSVGKSQLKLKALKHEKEYTKLKLETCLFTKRNHDKVLELCSKLGVRLVWTNGYVFSIIINRNVFIGRETIDRLAKEQLLEEQLEKLLS